MVKMGNFVLCVCLFVSLPQLKKFFFSPFSFPNIPPPSRVSSGPALRPDGPCPRRPFRSPRPSGTFFVGFRASTPLCPAASCARGSPRRTPGVTPRALCPPSDARGRGRRFPYATISAGSSPVHTAASQGVLSECSSGHPHGFAACGGRGGRSVILLPSRHRKKPRRPSSAHP